MKWATKKSEIAFSGGNVREGWGEKEKKRRKEEERERGRYILEIMISI